jgi:hypothetical protein
MDPFLENQEWEDFHAKLNTAMSDALSPSVEPGYVVRVERRIYVEHASGEEQQRRADVAIVSSHEPGYAPKGAGAAVSVTPVEGLLAMAEEIHETYIVIRDRETREIVTVIETLSPGNKRPGSTGRQTYLTKRDEILSSQASLVELDLLRGGARLPMATPLPAADYYAIISRAGRRPRADIFPWTLKDRLPVLPIPLRGDDPAVPLDLQEVFTGLYERAFYGLSIDYTAKLEPLLNDEDGVWMREVLSRNNGR